jgi:hypothetical protein
LSDSASTTLKEGIDPPASIKVKEKVRQRGKKPTRRLLRRQAGCGRGRAKQTQATEGASMSMKLFPNDVPRTCLDPVLFDLGASWRAPPNPNPSSYQTLEKRPKMAKLVVRFWWGSLLKVLCPTALTPCDNILSIRFSLQNAYQRIHMGIILRLSLAHRIILTTGRVRG